MKVKFVRFEKQARDIISFYFEASDKVHHTAGQFIELYLPHEDKDDRGIKRWFTLSSSPNENNLAITTNFSDPGSTFKQRLLELQKGQEVYMASPMGDFVLPKDTSIPLIFAAGGIGCTPFRSIIKWLKDKQEERDITLLYAAQSQDKVAFKELFKSYLGPKFKVMNGKLTAKTIMDLPDLTDEHYIYVSGPETMVETIYKDLKHSGFNKKHVYGDYFPNYPG